MKFSIEEINNNSTLIDGLKNGNLLFNSPERCKNPFLANDYGCVVKNLCDNHAVYLHNVVLMCSIGVFLCQAIPTLLFYLDSKKIIKLDKEIVKYLWIKDFITFALSIVGFGILLYFL